MEVARQVMTNPSEVGPGGSAWSQLDAAERLNTVTHGIGLSLSLLCGGLLMAKVIAAGDLWRIAACGVYVLSLIAVFAMSTLSHVCVNPRKREFYRMLDQGVIYLLIVATYTPFSVAYLHTAPWWTLLAVMWVFALAGFISKAIFAHAVDNVSVWPYVVLGWTAVLSAPTLAVLLPAAAVEWMVIGGVCYTVGTLFLIFDSRAVHFHAIWHVFVIAGSACHFFVILLFIAPLG